jgi:FMN phosphatase YigB (HAD superfamily)
MLDNFDTLLLDMNDTFMFGHDRFGGPRQFGRFYRSIGGTFPEEFATNLIANVYSSLVRKYPDPSYFERFPSIQDELKAMAPEEGLDPVQLELLVATFAYFELGTIPPEYALALSKLSKTHKLGLVADVWAPRARWIDEFSRAGVLCLFDAMSFSSDDGVVKPSPQPFRKVLAEIGSSKERTLMIGDSIRRDLGGAQAAGIACVLVGASCNSSALACVPNLLSLLE